MMGVRMTFINRLRKGIQNLPGIRRPNSDYQRFLQQYGWVQQTPNKNIGKLDVYYNAMKNVYISRSIKVFEIESLNNGFTITDSSTDNINYSRVNYLTDLFQNPQGWKNDYTFGLLNHNIWSSWKGTGDCFIEVDYDKIFDKTKPTINGFYFIPTEMMYYNLETNQWGLRNTGICYEPNEIIHIYKPSPEAKNNIWGECIIDQVASNIELEILGLRHNKNIFRNNGLDPRAVITFDTAIDAYDMEDELKRLQAQADTNPDGTIALRGAQFQKLAITNKDMDFQALLNYSRDEIITAFGVQPSKLGIRETASLGTGTGESQDKDFKKTLTGDCRFIEDSFNKKLGHNGFQEVFRFGELDISDQLQNTQIEDIRIKNGTLTINEARTERGLEPVDWGNEQPNKQPIALSQKYKNELNRMGLIRQH